jgi:hypothetical protein
VLTAATGDGKTSVRTPIGVYVEPERYELSVDLKDRRGAAPTPENQFTSAINQDTGEWLLGVTGKVRIAPGRYTVTTTIVTPRSGQEPSFSFLARPELRFTADARLTLDARTAKPSTMRVDQPAARGGFRMISQEVRTAASPYPYSIVDGVDPWFHEVYAASTPGVRSDAYKFTNWLHAEEPDVELTAESPERFPARAGWLGLGPEPDLSTRLATVHAGRGTPAELAKVDARGKLVTLAVPWETTLDELATAIRNVKAAGRRLVYVVPIRPDAQLAAVAGPPDKLPTFVLPTLVGGGVTGSRFVALSAKGGLTARLATKLTSRYRYEVAAIDHRAIRAVPNYDQATKDLGAVRTRYYGYTNPGIRNVYSSLTLQDVELYQLMSARLAVPGERVEYFKPGRWNLSVSNWEHNIADDLHATPWNLRRGGNGTLEWNKGRPCAHAHRNHAGRPG